MPTNYKVIEGGHTCDTFLYDDKETRHIIKYAKKAMPPDFFMTEAKTLQFLSTALAEKITPEVLEVNEKFLRLEYIPPQEASMDSMLESLLKLHHTQGPYYGFEFNTFYSFFKQDNTPRDNFIEFYIHQRVLPLIDHPLLTKEDRQRIEKICHNLPNLIDAKPAISLLHGDLWMTNLITSLDKTYFIDPAAYYGPREMDIAYARWIHPEHPLLDAYEAAFPLLSEFAQSRELYLIYPLLQHIHLFEEKYLPDLYKILRYWA
jgi:protein-ribulosamine 3-kinase